MFTCGRHIQEPRWPGHPRPSALHCLSIYEKRLTMIIYLYCSVETEIFGVSRIPLLTGMLIFVLVLKDSLRTFFKSLSLSWSLGSGPCPCPWGSGPGGPCPCPGPWGQVLVNIPAFYKHLKSVHYR